MQFKTGDRVFTRDGREVEILKVDAPCKQYPIIGMYVASGMPTSRYADGSFDGPGHTTTGDLLPPKRTREVTVWVSLTSTGRAHFFETEGHAKDAARLSYWKDALAVAVPATVTVEW